jgi:hypothetical protein
MGKIEKRCSKMVLNGGRWLGIIENGKRKLERVENGCE